MRCDVLLTKAHVLTMDEQFTVHPSAAVAVAGGALLAVGDIAHEYGGSWTGVAYSGPRLRSQHGHGRASEVRCILYASGRPLPGPAH